MSGLDDTLPEVDPHATERASVPSYELGAVLGTGGMGEVLLAHDVEMGRDVALKRMRGAAPTRDMTARFLREARIQARLDHPAIVPVHALGRDADDRPYFTMKRLAGITLQQSLETRAHRPQKLLRAFVEVCHAIEVAHERGVVHRDLKPANIMLGERGEVYVLDWGVARVVGESAQMTDVRPTDPAGDDAATATGTLLGTPGYMAPEQVRGELVQNASDVYALGAILFEILAGAPLHPRGGAALATTLDADRTCSPVARLPDGNTPPELDGLCVSALAFDPGARPSARELAAGVESYLDGDRDLERRRRLALDQLADARAALASGDASRRAEAIRAAGRAFVLDPDSDDACALLTRLTVAAPELLPPELERELADVQVRDARLRSRRGFYAYLMFLLFVPLWAVMRVQHPGVLAVVVGAIALTLVAQLVNWKIRYVPTGAFLATHFVTCVLVSRFASPFLVMPSLIAGVMLAITSLPGVMNRTWVALLWPAAASLAPFALEAVGVFHSTWSIGDDGAVILHGDVFAWLGSGPTIIATVMLTVVVSFYALGINRDRSAAQRAAYIQGWQMRQLLPPSSGGGR